MAEAMLEQELRCTGTTADGSPCTVTFALSDTPDGLRCLAHDEGRADRVREGQQRSLETRAAKAERRNSGAPDGMPVDAPKTPADVIVWSSWVTYAVATGAIDYKAAELINKSLATLSAALERDHGREMRKLRRQIRELRKKSGGLR